MFILTLNKKEILFKQPVVMGILNATPDSFFANSCTQNIDTALFTTEKMLLEGATFIDIGGQSTRPNSEFVTEDEELKRVIPIINAIHKKFPEAYISIDTFNAKIAKEAVENGATIVNDISGGNFDTKMFETIAQLNVPYICMHIKGTPQTMQQHTNYANVVTEVKNYFTEKINITNQFNIKNIVLDIGFGFAKNTKQNFELLKNLSQFKTLQKPLLVGVSRKSSIYKTLGITANEALNGTTVLNTIAILNGANILRVHDVKEAIETIKLSEHFL